MEQKYFDFSKIQGIEMEALLLRLKSLISSKKITNNLPDNFKGEIDEINYKIEKMNEISKIDFFDGGEYEHVHIWGKYVPYDEENCIRTCEYGDSEIKTHRWDYTYQMPTHTSVGYEQQICLDCGYVIYKEIPKTSVHTWNYISIDDIYHQKMCECGEVATEEHNWDEGVVTVEPTTTAGVMTYTCSVCGGTKTEEIPPAPVLAESNTWYQGSIARGNITQIDIVPTYNGSTYTESWDASETNDGSIVCYIDGTNLIIAGNGCDKIKANLNSKNAFAQFNRVNSINGLKILDTSDVTNMNGMFHQVGAKILDLSNFNTLKVTDMSYMFRGAQSLTTIYVSNSFVTNNVLNSTQMFYSVYNIVGGNGTRYSSLNITATYARIDTVDTPGYFTKKV